MKANLYVCVYIYDLNTHTHTQDSEDDKAGPEDTPKRRPKRPSSPNAGKEMVSPRALDLGEQLAEVMRKMALTPKSYKAAMNHAAELMIPRVCSTPNCGVRLHGKYADTGLCSKCSSGTKKEKHKCRICEKGLRGEYIAIGLCAHCFKVQQRKDGKGAKGGV